MRPRIVVFTGGQAEHANTSRESGAWVCQYIPRSKYDVTPVEVTHDGQWKVPMGNLPKGGDIARTMDMLFQAVPAQDPKKALEKLLDRPVDSMITLLRGKGGDDGAMHGLGDMLGIRVAGSNRKVSDSTFNKHRLSHALSGVAPTPYSKLVRHTENREEIVPNLWSEFIPPFFVKPTRGAGSHGITKIHSLKELSRSLLQAQKEKQDVLVQEYRPGLELSVTIYADPKKGIRTLPATIITPHTSSFYDYQGKQKNNGATFHSVHSSDSSLAEQAETIARDVYESLECDGIATIDMMANEGAIDVLELNTIPSFHTGSPVHHQLKQSMLHPEHLLAGLL